MTDASQEPAPDGSVFQFETKPLLALTAAEQGRLRELTLGTPGAYMLACLRERPRRTQASSRPPPAFLEPPFTSTLRWGIMEPAFHPAQ